MGNVENINAGFARETTRKNRARARLGLTGRASPPSPRVSSRRSSRARAPRLPAVDIFRTPMFLSAT